MTLSVPEALRVHFGTANTETLSKGLDWHDHVRIAADGRQGRGLTLETFFIGGFECATGRERSGRRFDNVQSTEHEERVSEDFSLLRSVGICVAKEGVRWPLVDRGFGRYDFSSLDPILAAAREQRISLIFDLFHFGWPEELNPFSWSFLQRFEDYCRATALYLLHHGDGPFYFSVVAQPSFLAWASTDGSILASVDGDGRDLKLRLCEAAITGADAIHSLMPDACFISSDPVCRVAPPFGAEHLSGDADHFNEAVVFEAWDMIAGRLHPELGGNEQRLDVIGMYWDWRNQWQMGQEGEALADYDIRRWSLRDQIRYVWARYSREIILEVGNVAGDDRESCLRYVTDEVEAMMNEGVPVKGICLESILGTPGLQGGKTWSDCGVWDLVPTSHGLLRVAHAGALCALRNAVSRLDGLAFQAGSLPKALLM